MPKIQYLLIGGICLLGCHSNAERSHRHYMASMISTSFQLALAEENLPEMEQFLGSDTIYVQTPLLVDPDNISGAGPVEEYSGDDLWLKESLPHHVDFWRLIPVNAGSIDSLTSSRSEFDEYLTFFRISSHNKIVFHLIINRVNREGYNYIDRGRMIFTFIRIRSKWVLKEYDFTWG